MLDFDLWHFATVFFNKHILFSKTDVQDTVSSNLYKLEMDKKRRASDALSCEELRQEEDRLDQRREEIQEKVRKSAEAYSEAL